ncbi:MAG: hypothetical protein ACYDIE_14725 [Candidatus Krumholzibacteriia bacterium]
MDKDALRRSIISHIESELAAIGYDLLDVRLFTGGGRLHVRVFLDREGGIDLAGCVAAGRTIGMLLEEATFLGEAYVIEASSPGVRRPLRLPAHFAAVIGQRIELRAGQGRQTTRRGVLLAVGPEGLRLRGEPGPAAPAADEAADAVDGVDGDGEAAGAVAEASVAPVIAEPRAPESEFTVAWADLVAANLEPDFDIQALINADRRRQRDERKTQRNQAREAREARMARRRRPKTE